VTHGSSIRDYAIEQMSHLLTRLAFEVHRVAKKPEPDEIHDLRVSIRRFSQGLSIFVDFFPATEIKRVRTRLKRMMRLTSEIRDCDIALAFLEDMKYVAHRRRFQRERGGYERELSEMVRRWSARDFSAEWRNGLSLDSV